MKIVIDHIKVPNSSGLIRGSDERMIILILLLKPVKFKFEAESLRKMNYFISKQIANEKRLSPNFGFKMATMSFPLSAVNDPMNNDSLFIR